MRRLLARLGRRRSRLAGAARDALRGRHGLEIGGPSRIFSPKGRLPLYDVIDALDGCDFREDTPRRPERRSDEGYRYLPDRPAGTLHLCEAVDLETVEAGHYDFVLCSHVLEHIANPLRALESWGRVTKGNARLLLVLPHREATFDHDRPLTTIEHLVADRLAGVGEDDRTHVSEILALHDLTRDPGHKTTQELEASARSNFEKRRLHHHVFDTALAIRMLGEAGWEVRDVDVMRPFHIALLSAKSSAPDHAALLAPDAEWRRRSPFASDRS